MLYENRCPALKLTLSACLWICTTCMKPACMCPMQSQLPHCALVTTEYDIMEHHLMVHHPWSPMLNNKNCRWAAVPTIPGPLQQMQLTCMCHMCASVEVWLGWHARRCLRTLFQKIIPNHPSTASQMSASGNQCKQPVTAGAPVDSRHIESPDIDAIRTSYTWCRGGCLWGCCFAGWAGLCRALFCVELPSGVINGIPSCVINFVYLPTSTGLPGRKVLPSVSACLENFPS